MELSNADLRFLTQLCKRMETYCSWPPPMGTPNRPYNAYRILRHKDLPKLKRKLEKWRNTSTGGQAT